MPKKDTVTITDNSTGNAIECPILRGVHGAPVIDIQGVYKELGYFTHDPGFTTTSSCESRITYIDGDEGVLLYRGYPIEQLAAKSSYLEVCYLLLYGELPTPGQWQDFEARVRKHSMVHEDGRHFLRGYRRGAHPMGMLVGLTGAMSTFYHASLDVGNPEHRDRSALRVISKMPTLAAFIYKHRIGQPYVYPNNKLSFVENFLNMMFSVPAEEYVPDPVAVKALELMLILHADHEQNASTSTVRLAGSSGANPYACIAGGVATLWGPAHGGANEAVIKMLHAIGDASEIPKYIARAKDKNDSFRLMGFGHRVYKNFDPRAKLIRKACYELLDKLDASEQPIFEIALSLEKIALEDEYFISRKLYPNVDFYSGIILSALKIPLSMFTVMFAMGRSVGWISQWMEMMADDNQRIGRPRQIYKGAAKRDYVSMTERS